MEIVETLPPHLELGYEACPSCGGLKMRGPLLCSQCLEPQPWPTPQLMAERAEFDPGPRTCKRCEMQHRCSARLRLDGAHWVLCEIPDELDMLIRR